MCLGIPGQVLSISDDDDPLLKVGQVSFGGNIKEISLAYVPEAKVNDFVIVHAGFALNIIDEKEANEVLSYMKEMGEGLEELERMEAKAVKENNIEPEKLH